jgi:hypothetical protein
MSILFQANQNLLVNIFYFDGIKYANMYMVHQINIRYIYDVNLVQISCFRNCENSTNHSEHYTSRCHNRLQVNYSVLTM